MRPNLQFSMHELSKLDLENGQASLGMRVVELFSEAGGEVQRSDLQLNEHKFSSALDSVVVVDNSLHDAVTLASTDGLCGQRSTRPQM